MNDLVFLDYTFLFDAKNTFQHLYEFEKVLGDAFLAHGYQAEVIKSVGGAPSKRIFYIRKTQPMVEQQKNPVGRPQTIKGKIKQLSDRKLPKPALQFMKGK